MQNKDSGWKDIMKGEKINDLETLCDAYLCPDRGKNARCYLDIYKFCSYYDKMSRYFSDYLKDKKDVN